MQCLQVEKDTEKCLYFSEEKKHRKVEPAKLIELRVFVTTNVDTKAQWYMVNLLTYYLF